MENKDKEYTLTFGYGDAKGSIKMKNSNNRVIAKIGDIMLDALSYFKWSNAVRFLDKYNDKKEKRRIVGKETPIPPKFIIEILNNAFQESEEVLQDNWNNLLVNWQDLERNCDKSYMYIEILKNLGINEIKLLKLIDNEIDDSYDRKDQNMYIDGLILKEHMGLSDDDYELMILNLYRLKICESFKIPGKGVTIGNLPVVADAGIEKFRLTIIGFNLIKNIQN